MYFATIKKNPKLLSSPPALLRADISHAAGWHGRAPGGSGQGSVVPDSTLTPPYQAGHQAPTWPLATPWPPSLSVSPGSGFRHSSPRPHENLSAGLRPPVLLQPISHTDVCEELPNADRIVPRSQSSAAGGVPWGSGPRGSPSESPRPAPALPAS